MPKVQEPIMMLHVTVTGIHKGKVVFLLGGSSAAGVLLLSSSSSSLTWDVGAHSPVGLICWQEHCSCKLAHYIKYEPSHLSYKMYKELHCSQRSTNLAASSYKRCKLSCYLGSMKCLRERIRAVQRAKGDTKKQSDNQRAWRHLLFWWTMQQK